MSGSIAGILVCLSLSEASSWFAQGRSADRHLVARAVLRCRHLVSIGSKDVRHLDPCCLQNPKGIHCRDIFPTYAAESNVVSEYGCKKLACCVVLHGLET